MKNILYKDVNMTLVLGIMLLSGCCMKEVGVLSPKIHPWNTQELYYYVDENIPTTTMQYIYEILEEIESKVNLTFYEVSDDYKNADWVLRFIDGDYNEATAGMCHRPEIILNTYSKGIVYHEIFHYLGLMHEHQRPGREEHVIILWENIPEENMSDFVVRDSTQYPYNLDNYDYDINSILHYSTQHTFGEALLDKDGNRIEPNRRPSDMDWAKLKEIYN